MIVFWAAVEALAVIGAFLVITAVVVAADNWLHREKKNR